MNIELRLLALMLKSGDFTPLTSGDIVKEHFETAQGEALYKFITDYRNETDNLAAYPSLAVVRSRFRKSGMELGDPDPGDTMATLVYETRLERFKSELRQLAANAEQIAATSTDPFGETIPLIAALRRATESAQKADHASVASSIGKVAANYKNKDILPNGIPWPWPLFTEATRGLHKKECIAIVGRPKSRKTFTALRVATHAYKHYGTRVLVFTPEMPVRQILLRSIAHLCDLPYSEFKSGAMQEAEEARLFEAAKDYARIEKCDDLLYHMQMQELYPNLHNDHRSPSFDIIQSTSRDTAWMAAQIELYEPDLVLVDSYYRHRGVGQKKNDSDWRAMTAISREMKDLAMQHNIAMILTSQLNREAQKSVGDINSIAFSDAIAADMDGIYRVVTGKLEGQEISALVGYASRDVAFEGIMIHNAPCYDYSEIGKITNRRVVEDLLKQEEAANTKEETDRLRAQLREKAGLPAETLAQKAQAQKGASTKTVSPLVGRRARKLPGMGAFASQLKDGIRAADQD